jgi:hypothetical protein
MSVETQFLLADQRNGDKPKPRGDAFFGGGHRDELVMSLLRPDWAACSELSARETR